jgi:hypothetical protein
MRMSADMFHVERATRLRQAYGASAEVRERLRRTKVDDRERPEDLKEEQLSRPGCNDQRMPCGRTTWVAERSLLVRISADMFHVEHLIITNVDVCLWKR